MSVGSNVFGVVSAYTVIVPPRRAPGTSGAGPVAVGSSALVWLPMLGALPRSLFGSGWPHPAVAVRAAIRAAVTRRGGISTSASQPGGTAAGVRDSL